jgi:lauroyl/myristoyl acyltransferase
MALRHFGSDVVSLFVGAVPRRFRFRAAVRMAAVATPLLRFHPIVRQRLRMRVETAQEIVTFHLLDILTRHGIAFDPRIRTVGMEHFEAAAAKGAGVLFVGPHSMLSVLALRKLLDMQRDAAVVSPDPVLFPGTAIHVRTIEPSFTYLLEVRRMLRANTIVAAMIDRDVVAGRSEFAMPTAQGPIVIADALIRLAVRAEAPVVFFATRMREGEFVITLGAAAEGSPSAEAITAAFVAFVQEHVSDVARNVNARAHV